MDFVIAEKHLSSFIDNLGPGVKHVISVPSESDSVKFTNRN